MFTCPLLQLFHSYAWQASPLAIERTITWKVNSFEACKFSSLGRNTKRNSAEFVRSRFTAIIDIQRSTPSVIVKMIFGDFSPFLIWPCVLAFLRAPLSIRSTLFFPRPFVDTNTCRPVCQLDSTLPLTRLESLLLALYTATSLFTFSIDLQDCHEEHVPPLNRFRRATFSCNCNFNSLWLLIFADWSVQVDTMHSFRSSS